MTRVAIIGGGIGGLTAANALSRAGIEVAVYEAAAELREIGAGVALQPNAMNVLRAIGVEADVRKVAGRSQWQLMHNWKTGRVIGKTSRQQQAASFGTEGATVHRADLLDVLAAALPAGIVTLGKRCTEVRPGGGIGGRAVRGRQRDRGRRHCRRGRHPLTGPRLPVRPGRPPVHREDLLSQRHPDRSGPRRPARHRRRPVVRPARHDRAVPAARQGADQRRLPLRR